MTHSRSVSVIMTVRNDLDGCRTTLDSLFGQDRSPDEIVVVDGGSTDGTLEMLRARTEGMPTLRIITAIDTNIAAGRNVAAREATGEIIAATDAGCVCQPDWLEQLMRPFDEDSDVEFVAGFYSVDAQSLLEEVVGLTTMRGQLDPVNPLEFNPSARSLACTKDVWLRAGGWPEWLGFSEDTLFDHKVRRMGVGWRFAESAVVAWRPRSSVGAIAKQFYRYGTGRGHTQIGAPSFLYNLRNATIVGASLCLSLVFPWAIAASVILLAYFYVWTFHVKAVRIAKRTGRKAAYPLCLFVHWIVLFSNLAGYVVGSWQRFRNRDRYRRQMDAYLVVT